MQTAGPPGPAGADGTNGTNGADGQLRIYGDGSAGALTVSGTDALFSTVAANGNTQFTDVTIAPGHSLLVPSGSIIRCTGTFTIDGTLIVNEHFGSGGQGFFSSGTEDVVQNPAASVGGSVAGDGELGDSSQLRDGGIGASSISVGEAQNILNPGIVGGGGGAGSLGGEGGDGGGTVVILARTAIVNSASGIIDASGHSAGSGGGGGGGGIVILASEGSIASAGTITVRGGSGGPSSDRDGAGG